MLFQAPPLTDTELAVLGEIVEIRERLKYSLHAPRRWSGHLHRNSLAKAVQGSNSIEGYQVNDDDAIAAVEGEEMLTAEAETKAAIDGYRDAMTYVLVLAGDPFFDYSDQLLKSMHFMMLKHNLGKHPGRWRPGSIFVRDDQRQVTVYEGPDVDLVPELMAELVAALNEGASEPAVIRAAMAHLNLAMIHPFSDGNGRMARCLQALVLAREGILEPHFCSIEEYLGHNTQDYYRVLTEVGQGRWNPERDARTWVRFNLLAHYRQAKTLVRRTREIERLWNAMELEIQRRKLPERVIFALTDAASGYRVRNATYRKSAEVSDFVASRDFKLLVDLGLLVTDGEKRGRGYRASPAIRQVWESTREPRVPLDDPFDRS
jgi:Fic family protein